MNNTVRTLLVFAAGVGIGAFGTTMIIKNKYEQLAQEEIASVRETVARRRTEPDEKEGKVLRIPRYKNLVAHYNGMGDANAENAIADPAELEHPMDDGEAYDKYSRISEKANNSRDTRKPYVIGVEEFSEDMTHFDKLTIYYYEDDDTLVEGGEDIITDVNGTIGTDSLDHFGDNSDDPDIVYVRNERISVDYEVIRLPKSYAETVLGYEKDEGKGRKVRRGEVDEE